MAETNGCKPQLTAFSCIYCASMAGDTAGLMRLSYPASVKLIKLPCSGKVDVEYLLRAFAEGADGVYIVACPIGNCHHLQGNARATKRIAYTKKLLDEIGLGGERLEIFYMSGSQAHAFAHAAQEMTERVQKLGANPLGRNGGSL